MPYNGLAMHSYFNDLKNETMEVNNAKDYIEILDAAGESWSNDNDALSDAMEDYAKMYHQAQLKLLGIADVRHQVCPLCDGIGSGHFEGDAQVFTCDSCDGTGKIVTYRFE